MKEALDWVIHIAIAVVIALLIVNFVGQRTIVNGNSMYPTLQDGNQLIIEKISPKFGKLNHGDIVTLKVPEFIGAEKEYAIKRVIGLEGDTVEIKNGKVIVNGKELKEDYINGNYTQTEKSGDINLTLEKGQIFVLGDNRMPRESYDSRSMGPIDANKVTAKAILRYWPVSEFGTLK